MKEIVLKFDTSSGEVKIEAKGFNGSSCKDATEFLRRALGNCTEFNKKAEWYERNLEVAGQCNSNLCG